MKPTSLAHRFSRSSGGFAAAVCTLLAIAPFLSTTPASAQELCQGELVTALSGPHAVTSQPLSDLASLQRRLPQLEASIRTAIAKDPTLSPAVADALIAAIREGKGISERSLQRDEAIHWMAYQPKPGVIDTISPVCLKLQRDYNAFDFSIELPALAATTQADPTCSIATTRSCTEGDRNYRVNLSGSSPGAQVTMTASGGSAVSIAGAGSSWTVADPGPYELDTTFTVRVDNPTPAAAESRVYHFMMPKVCGNLVYLGQEPGSPTTLAAIPAFCEKSVLVAACPVPVVPVLAPETPIALLAPKADRCAAAAGGSTVRGFLFGFFPSGDIDHNILVSSGPVRETFELEDGYGLGGSYEHRFGPVVGLEVAMLVGRGDSELELSEGAPAHTGTDSHRTNFYALTAGPNFHLFPCKAFDLYAGPFIGYGGFADPNYWVGDHHFAATFDGGFVWGAQLGLDVPISGGPWGFHTALRYMDLSQDTSAGSISVDPLILELGFAYKF
jgi:hypothetical protein